MLLTMDTHSMLISSDNQYRQELRLIMTESEISDLHRFLSDIELVNPDAPKVALDLRAELWYMLIEVRVFNAYLKEGGKQ